MNAQQIVFFLLAALAFSYVATILSRKSRQASSQSTSQPPPEPHRLSDMGRFTVTIFSGNAVFRAFEACEILQDRSGAVFAKAAGEADFTALIAPFAIERISAATSPGEVNVPKLHYRASFNLADPTQPQWNIVKAFPLQSAHGCPSYHLVLTNGRSIVVSGHLEFMPLQN